MTDNRPGTMEEWAALEARLAADEEPILEDLRRVGVDVPTVWSITELGRHPESIPILLDHFGRPYDPGIRDGIARALGGREARSIWRMLVNLYAAERDQRVRQGLAATVAKAATDATMDELLELIADPRHGESRGLLLTARFPPRAAKALERLASDPDLRLVVPQVLRRLRRKPRGDRSMAPGPLDPALAEASGGLDRSEVRATLLRLQHRQIGLEQAHVRAIQRIVDGLDVDEEKELRFDLGSSDHPEPLVVRVFLDDPEAVDLSFFGTATMIAAIRAELERGGEDEDTDADSPSRRRRGQAQT